MRFLHSATPKARKRHECSWCGQAIPVGEKYVRQRLIFEGDHVVNKFHEECDEACSAEAREEGGVFEFMPGENERPPRVRSPANHG